MSWLESQLDWVTDATSKLKCLVAKDCPAPGETDAPEAAGEAIGGARRNGEPVRRQAKSQLLEFPAAAAAAGAKSALDMTSGLTDREWLLYSSRVLNMPVEVLVSLSEKCQASQSVDSSACQRLSQRLSQAAYRPDLFSSATPRLIPIQPPASATGNKGTAQGQGIATRNSSSRHPEEVPASPRAPETPRTPSLHKAAACAPGTPRTPSGSSAPSFREASGSWEPGTPWAPGTPRAPGMSWTPGTPRAPGTPWASGTPRASGTPWGPETPRSPTSPREPFSPRVSPLPRVSGTPRTSRPQTPRTQNRPSSAGGTRGARGGVRSHKAGASWVRTHVVEASRRERTAVMEGTVVPSNARPVKPPTSVNPVVAALMRNSRYGRGVPARAPDNLKTVRVKKGDTLATVAKQHGMRIRDLQRLNNLRSDYIGEGAVLTVATGWLWRSLPPAIRPGIRRTSRPLFSRIPSTFTISPSSALKPRPGVPRSLPAPAPAPVPRFLGIGGPSATAKSIRLPKGRWERGPKSFNKRVEGWLRFASPLIDGFVSSSFGWRWGAFHEGVDLAAETGSPILASDKGIVTYSGWSGGYGKLVTIVHDGGFSTRYGHCSALMARVGQRVSRGQQIACVGATGRATGPHVHFEVRKNGQALDPFKWCDL